MDKGDSKLVGVSNTPSDADVASVTEDSEFLVSAAQVELPDARLPHSPVASLAESLDARLALEEPLHEEAAVPAASGGAEIFSLSSLQQLLRICKQPVSLLINLVVNA